MVLPDLVAIYRDGVGGPSYQEKVIRNEIGQVLDVILNFCPNYKPQILYTLVNKKSNTRFAEKSGEDYFNPAPGTIVDTGFV